MTNPGNPNNQPPYLVTIHFDKGNYDGFDNKHGRVTSSDHPEIRSGSVVEYHLDKSVGDVLRLENREFRVTLENGFKVDDPEGTSMQCEVLDTDPWRTT